MTNIRNHRVSANSVAAGFTVYTAVGSWGPPILRALGFVEMASDLDWQWVLYVNENLNWPAIYGFGFFMGTAALIGINADLILVWGKRWRKRNIKIWDSTARDAIFHIAYRSIFGEGKQDRECFESAVSAFNQALQSGLLRLKGRRPKVAFTMDVPKKDRKSLVLDPETVTDQKKGTGGKLLNIEKSNEVEYEGVLVDRNQIERLWPKSKKSLHSDISGY